MQRHPKSPVSHIYIYCSATEAARGRTAYWDGRNDVGEPVARGLYFYTFTAGEFAATRRMLILK